MEKRGIIEAGRTPPETDDKQASDSDLEDHITKRAADAVQETCREQKKEFHSGE